MKQRVITVLAVILLAGVAATVPVAAASPGCTSSDLLCYQPAAQKLVDTVTTVTEPPIAVPEWLK